MQITEVAPGNHVVRCGSDGSVKRSETSSESPCLSKRESRSPGSWLFGTLNGLGVKYRQMNLVAGRRDAVLAAWGSGSVNMHRKNDGSVRSEV